jgi:DeoR/GlpR family transcriptional regulator of sugar metabolism
MKRLERFRKIMELLEEHGNASTVFLSKALDLSESSIRRDINHMASLPQYCDVKRVHGGIILDRDIRGSEYMFELKLELNKELKHAIAKRAVEFVDEGDNIIIDSGSTCLYFARLLHAKGMLKVITTDIMIAGELGKHGNIESNIIGGIIRPGYYTVGGIAALENLDRFRADKAFLSVDAIDLKEGITNVSEFEVGIKQKILQSVDRVFLLVDSSKFSRRTFYKVADLSTAFTIISNDSLDSNVAARFREKGLELQLV